MADIAALHFEDDEIIRSIYQIADKYRSDHELTSAARVSVLIPSWPLPLIRMTAIIRSTNFRIPEVDDFLAEFKHRNVDVTFYSDPDYPPQRVGLPESPVNAYVWETGTYMELIGGEMSIGYWRSTPAG
jgi:hypothetical protein